MSGFDANRVFTVPIHDQPQASVPELPSETEQLLYDFLQSFRVGEDFVYRCAPWNYITRVYSIKDQG